MLPESEMFQGQPLVGNRFHSKPLQNRSCPRHKSDGNISQPPSNWTSTLKELHSDRETGTQCEPLSDQSIGSITPSTVIVSSDLPTDVRELQVSHETPNTREHDDEKSSNLKVQHSAKESDQDEYSLGDVANATLTDPDSKHTTLAEDKKPTFRPAEGQLTKKKSKSKRKKARDGDQKPQADPALTDLPTRLIEPGKDLSKDFPPLVSSYNKVLIKSPSAAPEVVSSAGTKTFAKAVSLAALPQGDVTYPLSASRAPPRTCSLLDGSTDALGAKNGNICTNKKVSEKSMEVTSGEKPSVSECQMPDTESQRSAMKLLSRNSDCSVDNFTDSTSAPDLEILTPQLSSQSVTPTSSSLVDGKANSTPAALVSTSATYPQASRRDSKARLEKSVITDLTGNGSDTGVDPERLRDHLRIGALEQPHTRTESFGARGKEVVDITQQTSIDEVDGAAASMVGAPKTHVSPTASPKTPLGSPHGPEKPERRSSVSRPSTPGPITTHKKSLRHKGSTPTKPSFTNASKAAQGGGISPSKYRLPPLSSPNTLLTENHRHASAVVRKTLH